MGNRTPQKALFEKLNCRAFETVEEIQSLWSGYGSVSRVEFDGGGASTAILKHIRFSQSKKERNTDSHRRKLRSYGVEVEWYKHYSEMCDASCRVPAFLGAANVGDSIYILLEDLDAAGFPLRRDQPKAKELDACLFWLANFHATFLGSRPEGLWKNGTYWHLATRKQEHAKMPGGNLKRDAQQLDQALNAAKFMTFVHGDAKPANYCFSRDGRVAAVDFQYVGRGCGMKDLAYLLWGRASRHESDLKERYFNHLRAAVGARRLDVDFDALKREWMALYPVACDDFERFLQGWLPSR